MKIDALFAFFFSMAIVYAIDDKTSLYNLTSGIFEADEIRIMDRYVHQLIGIPYGRTPELFEKPVEYRADDEQKDTQKARDWSPMCIQPVIFHNSFYGNFKLPHDYEMSFNCLYMNIYIPSGFLKNSKIDQDRKKQPKKEKLSAMFFIHGGSNAAGAASFMDPSGLAAAGQVIVAMPNYRLDVLGFLSIFNGSHTHGNYGLWDQVLALKWLHTNCLSLGCDPDSITVFGHSAGSSDTMLLALSQHAQPYIRRIIMQSGSGLAHWSFLYETHLIEKATKSPQLYDAIDFKSSKYIASLRDTFTNFLIHTTCNLTSKHECIRNRLAIFIRATSNVRSYKGSEQAFIKFFDNLIDLLDLHEFMSLFGWIYKHFREYLKSDLFYFNSTTAKPERSGATNNISDKLFLVYNANSNNTTAASLASARIQALNSRNNFEKKNYDNDSTVYMRVDSSKKSAVACYSELAISIRDSFTLNYACEFLKNYDDAENQAKFMASQVVRYFMSCFKLYHERTSNDESRPEYYAPFNVDLFIYEMKLCYDPINVKKNNLVREVSCLTENSNYLHRPTKDGELIERMPQDELKTSLFMNSKIDVLVGLTSHESFYFLLHDYNIHDILVHTLIYSSILNLTDNIVDKLNELKSMPELGNCLKRNLFGHYNITMTNRELEANSLKNKINSIELISDFDFVLPMITQLNFYTNFSSEQQQEKQENNEERPGRLFVYEYSHITSFNYLLDHLKTYHIGYDQALVKLNYSVVPHFSELDFVFGLPLLSMSGLLKGQSRDGKYLYNYTKDEVEFSLLMIDYWTNFAKYGDPNKESPKEALVKLKKPQWPKFDANNPSVFKLAAKKQEQATASLFSEWQAKHDFWYKLLPNEIYNECKNNVNQYSSEKQPISAMNSSIVEKPFNSMIFLCLSLLLSLLFY